MQSSYAEADLGRQTRYAGQFPSMELKIVLAISEISFVLFNENADNSIFS